MANDDDDDTLANKVSAMLEHITSEGLDIFYAGRSRRSDCCCDNPCSPCFIWDNDRPWKEFFSVAKKQGASTIVARINRLASDDLNAIKVLEQALPEGEENENNNTCCDHDEKSETPHVDYNVLSSQLGNIGSYNFLWMADGCVFSLSETADWYRPIAAAYFADNYGDYKLNALHPLTSTPSTDAGAAQHGYYCSYCRPDRVVLPKALQEKTIKELADELVDCIKKHSSDLGYGIRYHISDMFWEEKGLHRNALSGAARYLVKSVELEVSKKLKAIQQEQENERMPALAEECVKWCKEHGVSRLTMTIVGTFMNSKETRLSVNGKYILFLKASSMLAQSSTREGLPS